MLFEQQSELLADQLPYERRRMFSVEESFSFTPAKVPRLAVWRAELAGSRLFRVQSTGHQVSLIEQTCTSLLMPRRGTIEVRTSQSSFVARPGETLLFAPNKRTTTVVPDRFGMYECDCVLIPTATETAEQPSGRLRRHTTERVFSGSLARRPDASLLGLLEYLVSHAMQPDSPLAAIGVRNSAGVLVEELTADLIDRLDDLPAIDALATAYETRLVRSAEELMLAHLDQPLTMRDLAGRLGVSVRRLQYAFQRVRNATPRAVLGELRLDRARRLLTDPGEACTVTEVALACGVAHFGRFAAGYAARFGELPSDTRRRVRR